MKWIVSSLWIKVSRAIRSFSAESLLSLDSLLVSDELRKRSEDESAGGRPIKPLILCETCEVDEPAVAGRLSRALPKLSDRRDLGWPVLTVRGGRGFTR